MKSSSYMIPSDYDLVGEQWIYDNWCSLYLGSRYVVDSTSIDILIIYGSAQVFLHFEEFYTLREQLNRT